MRRAAPRLVSLAIGTLLLAAWAPLLPGAAGAQSCPPGCTCISNSFGRPDIETTVVDCSYQGFSSFPLSLPNTTTELFMQVWRQGSRGQGRGGQGLPPAHPNARPGASTPLASDAGSAASALFASRQRGPSLTSWGR